MSGTRDGFSHSALCCEAPGTATDLRPAARSLDQAGTAGPGCPATAAHRGQHSTRTARST